MKSRGPPFHRRDGRLPVIDHDAASIAVTSPLPAAQFAERPCCRALAVGRRARAPSAHAQRSVSVVRDAEIEALVRDYARPILEAAGLARSGIEIVLVNDPPFNAFVAGRRIFINTGALLQSRDAQRDHRRAGARGRPHRRRPPGAPARPARARQTMAIVAACSASAPSSPGAATGTGGLAQAGAGIAMGGARSRAARPARATSAREEMTADRSASPIWNATGQSAQRHADDIRALRRARMALAGRARRSLPDQPSRCRASASRILKTLAQAAPISTATIRPRCSSATT